MIKRCMGKEMNDNLDKEVLVWGDVIVNFTEGKPVPETRERNKSLHSLSDV